MRFQISGLVFRITMVCFVMSVSAFAQTYSLSGKVTDTARHAVPSATVSAKSVADGKTYTAKTNGDGVYTIPDLAAGDYKVSAIAGELRAEPIKVTLAAGEMTNLIVSPVAHHR